MPTFDLSREGWIPCAMKDGKTRDLAPRDALIMSNEIGAIVDPSPLVTVALHRFLLAVLHRNFGPDGKESWQRLWNAGAFDQDILTDYFDRWEGRFDLFDEKYPFYQSPILRSDEYMKRSKPMAKLAHELASGDNKTLFDHTMDDSSPEVTPPEAARRLLAYQAFALAEGEEKTVGKPEAPLADAAVFIVQGNTLFETMMLNMVEYGPEQPFAGEGTDMPVWERDDPESLIKDEGRVPTGYLDWLTWQSRRLLLIPESSAVREVRVSRGNRLPKGCKEFYGFGYDTMMSFGAIKKDNKTKRKYEAPIKFEVNRRLWRSFYPLVEAFKDKGPKTLSWLGELCWDNILPERVFPVGAFGLSKDPQRVANPLFWEMAVMDMPSEYLLDDDLSLRLRTVLEKVEAVGKQLSSATWSFFKQVLYEDRPPGKVNEKTVSRLANQYAHTHYWSEAEEFYSRFVVDLSKTPEAEHDALEDEVLKMIGKLAIEDFNRMVQEIGNNVNVLRASIRMGGRFVNGVRKEVGS